MSQTDLNVANGPGALVRADINDHLAALASNSSGAVAPGTTFPDQFWYDTGTGVLNQRDSSNTAWITRTREFATVAELALAYIRGAGSTANEVQTRGYAAAGDGGGALYRYAAAEPGHAGKVQSADGAWWEYVPGVWGVNAAAFGVLDNGNLVDTEFSNALDYVIDQRTSPTGYSGYGQDVLLLPKGTIRLSQQIAYTGSVLGLVIRGRGKMATAIEFESDTATMLALTTYVYLRIEYCSIIHVDQGAGFGSWTNKLVSRTNVGGGKGLHFHEVLTKNWAYVDYNSGTSGGDETTFSYCDIQDAQTVMYGRSSQAVVNRFIHGRIYGKTLKAFDVAGYGTTMIDDLNAIIDGVLLYVAASAGLFGIGSTYRLSNVKMEMLNSAGYGGGSRTQIVVVQASPQDAQCDVWMDNVTLQSGPTPDSSYPAISATQDTRLHWRGGALRTDHSIETEGGSTASSSTHGFVILEGLRAVPGPSSLVRSTTAASGQPPVIWRRCTGVPNVCDAPTIGPSYDEVRSSNDLSSGSSGYLYLSGGLDHALDFDGVSQALKEIRVVCGNKLGGDLIAKAYTDAGKGTQIGSTLTISTPNGSPAVGSIPGVENYIGTGVVVEITSAGTTAMRGYVQVVSDAVPNG